MIDPENSFGVGSRADLLRALLRMYQDPKAYFNEFTFRFNQRFYPSSAFRPLLGMAGGAEEPTVADLYSGDWVRPTCSGCLR